MPLFALRQRSLLSSAERACGSVFGRAEGSVVIRIRYTRVMRWEVLLLEPVNDWFLGLCKNDPLTADKVEEALDELAERGPELGRPLASRLHGSKIHNLKELRPRTPGDGRCASAVRVRSGAGGDHLCGGG
jgi:hypothetical protein